MTTFSITIPSDANDVTMQALNDAMDEYYYEMEKYFSELAKELNCSIDCARDVWYLRSRSRWSQKLEEELIELDKKNIHPNICEFGCNDESRKFMEDVIKEVERKHL